MKRKLVVTGLAKHGKDTVCEILRDHLDYSFKSSSMVAVEVGCFSQLAVKYGYKSDEEFFKDKDLYRPEMFQAIVDFNTPDLTALGTIILKKHDIYCGLRNREELLALKKKFPELLVVWICAKKRLGITEGADSITITPDDADCIIENNGFVESLYPKLAKLFKHS